MIWTSDLLMLFEQTAVRRAQQAHQVQVNAALAPLLDGLLTEANSTEMDKARARYLREHRRHDVWLRRRFERAGMSHAPLPFA